jgi:acetyl esterase/lipase
VPDHATKVDTRKDYLSPRCSKPFIDAFLGVPPAKDMVDPLVAPIFADLAGMPPMLVFWGGVELLREQIMAFIDKAKAAEVPIVTYCDEDMPHIYPLLPDFYPKNSERALECMTAWIAQAIQTKHALSK